MRANFMRPRAAAIAAACVAVTMGMAACRGGDDADPDMPREFKLQWFGYTN